MTCSIYRVQENLYDSPSVPLMQYIFIRYLYGRIY